MTYSFGLKTKMTLSNGLVSVSLLVKNGLLLTRLIKTYGSNIWSTSGKLTAIAIIVILAIAFQAFSIIFDMILINCVNDKKSRFVRFLNALILVLSLSVLVLDSVANALIEN